MSILISKGEKIELRYQLTDGIALMPKRVKAFLRNETGVLLSGYESGVELTHVGLGLFQDNNVIMPDTIAISATYIPYEDDGSTETIDYSYGFDLFQNKDAGSGEGLDMSTILKLANGFADSITVDVVDDDENIINIQVEDD